VDSKGNFGKVYSRDMMYAASRYTEAKLADICREIFGDIDSDAVDFTDNYDGTMKEPLLLPTAFPNILASANMGIAVGMASNICGFNLREVCETAIAFLKNPKCNLLDTLTAPDFTTGGELLFDREQISSIYQTGRGSFKLRAKWRYVKEQNIIEIYEIPFTTTIEQIIEKTQDCVKNGKIKDIADMRDESDLKGLQIAVDLKRGVNPEKLMRQLFRLTSLQDSFSCNFNILIAGTPRVMGVAEILDEWTAWRIETVRRRVFYDLNKKKEKLHLLRGLGKIILDIDKAIRIIRETDSEDEVVPNLMIGFGIDEVQAEYVAEIRLRSINREFILKRLKEIDTLESDIADLEDIVSSKDRVKKIITEELRDIAKKYGKPRRTEIVTAIELDTDEEEDDGTEAYPVTLFISRHGYFKKITPQSLRMSGEHKYKEDDAPFLTIETTNRSEIIVFTDRCQAYKARVSDFTDSKASLLGDYLPAKLGFDDDESFVYLAVAGSGSVLFAFDNGKIARVPINSYETKTNRKRLANAYSNKAPLVSVLYFEGEREIAAFTSDGKALVFSSAQLTPKTTRDTQGVQVVTLRGKAWLERITALDESGIDNPKPYRSANIPAAGKRYDGQLTLGE
jgi:DNA gyrase subunit A